MEFALLIYGDEKSWTEATPDEKREMYAQHDRFSKMLEERGAIRGGAELDASSTARTIRRGSGGDVSVTDGPFAETAEQFGGYYVIEAAGIDEAVALGRECPGAIIEVRPLVPTPESGS
jgi:hypothetical protein